jgi:hypothetical protein
MKPDESSTTPESIDPTGLWRLLFWLLYVVGSLALIFSWMLAMVPEPRSVQPGIYLPDLIVRSCSAVLLAFVVLLARWFWKIRNPFSPSGAERLMRAFMVLVWLELAIALVEAAGTAIFLAAGH